MLKSLYVLLGGIIFIYIKEIRLCQTITNYKDCITTRIVYKKGFLQSSIKESKLWQSSKLTNGRAHKGVQTLVWQCQRLFGRAKLKLAESSYPSIEH